VAGFARSVVLEGSTDGCFKGADVGFLGRLIGQHDPGVEECVRIEYPFDCPLGGDLDRGEAFGHELTFLGADSVLTGDGAAQAQRGVDDFVVGRLQRGRSFGVVAVEESKGVQVAVSSMAAHHDEQQPIRVAGGGGLDGFLHVGDVLAGHRDIADEKPFAAAHHELGGVQAPIPQLGASLLVICAAHVHGGAAHNVFDKFDVAVDLFGSAVDVDEQDGRGVGGIAGVGVFLQPTIPVWSSHSSAAGTVPVLMMAATVSPASRAVAKLPIRLRVTGAIGRSATVASVRIASVPSEPMSTPSKSGPSSSALRWITVPSARTASISTTWL
jgi:hypothetical protein